MPVAKNTSLLAAIARFHLQMGRNEPRLEISLSADFGPSAYPLCSVERGMTAARPRAVRALSALRDGRSARRGRFWSRSVRADRRLPATELTGYALRPNTARLGPCTAPGAYSDRQQDGGSRRLTFRSSSTGPHPAADLDSRARERSRCARAEPGCRRTCFARRSPGPLCWSRASSSERPRTSVTGAPRTYKDRPSPVSRPVEN